MEKSEIKIGTPVIYWGIILENGKRLNPLKTVINSDSWELGHGQTVCKIVGKSGGVCIKHLDPVTAGSLMAAKLNGLKEVSDEDIKNATKDFFEGKGASIKI